MFHKHGVLVPPTLRFGTDTGVNVESNVVPHPPRSWSRSPELLHVREIDFVSSKLLPMTCT